ncbi:MAG: hypothetical protein R3C56_37285 [Pirellulaceae bacterium]
MMPSSVLRSCPRTPQRNLPCLPKAIEVTPPSSPGENIRVAPEFDASFPSIPAALGRTNGSPPLSRAFPRLIMGEEVAVCYAIVTRSVRKGV